MADRAATGRLGEALAARYLEAAGLRLLARNWRCPHGEIDLVCDDGGTTVFVEVRTRSSRSHGRPEEGLSSRKVRAFLRAAHHWLATAEVTCREVRFDFVAVDLSGPTPRIRHGRAMFEGQDLEP